MNFRTDLALERHELSPSGNIKGVEIEKYTEEAMTISKIEIKTSEAAECMQKPEGKYITFGVKESEDMQDWLVLRFIC